MPLSDQTFARTTRFCSALRIHNHTLDDPFVSASPEAKATIARYYAAMAKLSSGLMQLVRLSHPQEVYAG